MKNNNISFMANNDNADVDDTSALNPIKHNGKLYQVNGLLNDNKITYDVILINGLVELYNDNDALVDVYDVKLDLTVNMATISHAETRNIICTFQFEMVNNFIKFKALKEIRHDLKLAGIDENVANDMQSIIRNYFLNNAEYFNQVIDETNDTTSEVIPSYDKQSVKSFKETLHEKYADNFFNYISDMSSKIVVDETDNLSNLVLGFCCVLFGIDGLFIEINGKSSKGKSYLVKSCVKYFIPDNYVIKINDITYSAFLDVAKDNPEYYNRIILIFGDLGDVTASKELLPVFNIGKILVTDKEYSRQKSVKDDNNDWTSKNGEFYLSVESMGLLFETIHENQFDDTKQHESRTITINPKSHKANKVVTHSYNSKKKITKQYKELHDRDELFAQGIEYIKERMHYAANENLTVYVPFINLFENIVGQSKTKNRTMQKLLSLMETYCILNSERCHKIIKKNHEIIIPCIDDVISFINMIYASSELRPYEKNILLKLKKDLAYLPENHYDNDDKQKTYGIEDAENSIDHIIKQVVIIKRELDFDYADNVKNRQNYETFFDDDDKLINKIISEYGFSEKNAKEKNKPMVFFRPSDLKRKYRNSDELQDIQNLDLLLHQFSENGYLKKLDVQHKRGNTYQNVYYLDKGINNIHDDYKISYDEKLDAIQRLIDDVELDITDCKTIISDYNVKKSDISIQKTSKKSKK